MASERLGIFHVKVLPTGGQFRWVVRDDSGEVVASGSECYPTERAAFHAGNAAARAIRRRLEGGERGEARQLT